MKTTAYYLGSILGSQIRSVLEAEAENAEAITDFITAIGFERQEGQEGIGKLRMFTFEMQRRNELGETETHSIQIPLLSIIPIPMLSIEKVDFDFDLQIRDVTKIDRNTVISSQFKPISHRLVASFPTKSRFKRITNGSGQTSTRSLDSNMSVKVSIVQTDFSLGLEKLLNLSELGIQDQTNDQGD